MNTKKIIGLLIAVVVVVFIGYTVYSSSNKEETLSVRTGEVTEETIVETLTTTGVLEADKTQDIYGQGVISELDVAVGDQVEEDDRLVLYQDGTAQTAHFDGTVTAVTIAPDEVDLSSQTGEAAITVSDLSHLKVGIQLTKSDAPIVKEGQTVTLTNGSKTFEGTVAHIDPIATTTTTQTGNTTALAATIEFDTPPEGLYAGFDIDVAITTNTAEQAISLPIEALLYNAENKPFVYTVENDKAQAQTIETGIQSDSAVEVKEGLSAGQTVILSPDEKVKNGIAVTTK